MKNALIYMVLVLTFGMACQEGSKENEMSKADRLKVINDLDDEIFGEGGNFDVAKMLAMVNNYGKFADENPDDAQTPEFLFKAGDIAMGLEKGELAIGFFNRLIEDYPDYEKVGYCYFLKGFIYENSLGELENAKAAYELFIEKYPNHEMTEGAKFSIKNLGKSPEDLIREFESNQAATTEEN